MFNSISTQASRLMSMTKRAHGDSKTKIVSITSGKGGVGKSTLTANFAYLLSKKGKKVLVLDADIGLANLQVLFNVKPIKTLHNYINDGDKITDIITSTVHNNLKLIAGSSGYEYASGENSLFFTRLIEDIVALNKFDILLIDTGAGLNDYVQEFLALSHLILAVTTTDPSALTDLYALLKMVSLKKDKLLICFNHTSKYETGKTITNSITKLALKNKLNRKFMVQYVGNIGGSSSIMTTSRLRKLYAQEFEHDVITAQLEMVVDNLIVHTG